MKIKNYTQLERRVRVLEKLAYKRYYEDSSNFDDELDSEADKILANYKSFDDDLQDEVDSAVKSKKYKRFKYNTIEEWLTDGLFNGKIDKRNHVTLYKALDMVEDTLSKLGISGSKFGINKTVELQNIIEEISNLSSIRANYVLVKALKSKKDELQHDIDRCHYDFSVNIDNLCKYIKSLVNLDIHEVICKQNRKNGFAEIQIVNRKNKNVYLKYHILLNTGNQFKEDYPYHAEEVKDKRWSSWINKLSELNDKIEDDILICVDGLRDGLVLNKKMKDLVKYLDRYCLNNGEKAVVEYSEYSQNKCFLGIVLKGQSHPSIKYLIEYNAPKFSITRKYPTNKYDVNKFSYYKLNDFADEVVTSDVEDMQNN